jgi:hypothetical protein
MLSSGPSSNNRSLCYPHNVTDKVSHPCKTDNADTEAYKTLGKLVAGLTTPVILVFDPVRTCLIGKILVKLVEDRIFRSPLTAQATCLSTPAKQTADKRPDRHFCYESREMFALVKRRLAMSVRGTSPACSQPAGLIETLT